ncbi:MAG: tetratricopeptide repeat protein [Nitrosomonadales bacterium]|nr:tetratricopeptide repeat protein [Nitrosomonadales bacterium]
MVNILNRFNHTRFLVRSCRHAAILVSALLFCASLPAQADDVQDANRLFKQGQHSQAMDKVNGVLANKPKDAQARFLKGLILTEQGRADDAIRMFSALTEDYPELPEPYNNLAVLYASQGQYDKAKSSLEMAIRTHPSYATAHENLGDIYAKMASQAYDRALQLDRSNTATQTKLAMIQDLFANNARPKSSTARNAPTDTASKPQPVVAPPAEPVITVPAAKPVETAKVAPVPPAKPAAPEKPVAPPPASANNSDEVLKTVKAWASAWSAQNVKQYLSFYAADFRTPDGESRADWEATRQARVSEPKSIRVGISDAKVSFSDATHATVTFRQSYRASHMKANGRKTLQLVKSNGKWLIQEERAK